MSKWIKVQEHPKKVYVVKHTRLGSIMYIMLKMESCCG